MTRFLSILNNELRLQIQVQPKSSKTGWGRVVEHGGNDWIRLNISSPPVDGAANKEAIKFLSKQFKTAKSNIRLIQGEKSRYKVFLVESYDQEKLQSFARGNDCNLG
jgi:uncharacterized protein